MSLLRTLSTIGGAIARAVSNNTSSSSGSGANKTSVITRSGANKTVSSGLQTSQNKRTSSVNNSLSSSNKNPLPSLTNPQPNQRTQYAGTNIGRDMPWGKEVDTSYNKVNQVKVTSPNGQSYLVGESQAEQMFQNMIKGGYATEADRGKYLQSTGGQMKSYDLYNTNKIYQNSQMRNQWENEQYNRNPEEAWNRRLQEMDDYLRGEHFKKTGENLQPNHFIQNGEVMKHFISTDSMPQSIRDGMQNSFPVSQQPTPNQIPQQNWQTQQNDFMQQAQREYEMQIQEQQRRMMQQRAEFEALMRQSEIDNKNRVNSNNYLESQINPNNSWKDESYKAEVGDVSSDAISKYLRDLEKGGNK